MSTRPIFQKGSLTKWHVTDKWKGVVRAENPIKRLIGLEIECASGGRPNMTRVAVGKWTGNIVSDGSIGTNTGFELNLAPAAGDKFLEQLKDITNEFKRTGVQVNENCGIHVHVDVSDFNIWDMRRLIALYRKVEPAMFKVLAERRTGNTYCVRCGDAWWSVFTDPGKTAELKRRLLGGIYGSLSVPQPNDAPAERKRKARNLEAAQSGKSNGTRYRALNVHSWFLRGTLEFRHAESMTEYASIRNWALTCAGIVEAALKMSQHDIDALQGSSLEILCKVAPTKTVKRWLQRRAENHGGLEARPSEDDRIDSAVSTLANDLAEQTPRRPQREPPQTPSTPSTQNTRGGR